ncbi:MAG: sulfatase-like hydrolase/transferase [Acidobacteriota bacterium]
MPRARRPFAVDALHLVVLSAFAVGQPLLELLGQRPEFFAVRRSLPIDLWLLAAVLSLVVPLPLIVLEGLARLVDRRLQRGLHGLLCTGLIAAILLPALDRSAALGAGLAFGLALLIGLAGALAVDRWRPARQLLTFMIPAVVIFPAVFLLRPDVGKILRPGEVEVVASTEATTPIVLLVFDELPLTSLLASPGAIDAVRYPNFAALADQATWFRRATAVSDFTVIAVPAILDGRLPDKARLPIAPDYPHSLFTLLGDSYEMNVSEVVTQICPARLCSANNSGEGLGARLGSLFSDLWILYLHVLLPTDWTGFLPPVSQNWMLFADTEAWESDWRRRARGDRVTQVERFLAGIQPTDRPVLHFLHVLLPHPPFEYLPSGQRYSLESHVVGLRGDRMADDEWAVVQNQQRHLLQLGYVDHLLGEVIDRLEAAGLWDRAVVVVAADHGAAFTAGLRNRRMTPENFAQILPVPLIIKAPEQHQGVIDERPASLIDVLPTITELVGAEVPWPVDGVSLADPTTVPRQLIEFVPYRRPMAEPIEIPPADLAAGERAALAQLEGRFPRAADGGRDLFRIGPLRAWLGREVSEQVLGPPTAYRYWLRLPTGALEVGSAASHLPAHLSGRLVDGGVTSPVELLVAVNGRLAAATRSWAFEPERWSAVVDPAVFQEGVNQVELFALERDPAAGSERLRPVPSVAASPMIGQNERGLYGYETWAVGVVRWTDGDAELTLPIAPSRPPRRLRLTIADNSPDGCRLRIFANGAERLDVRVEPLRQKDTWSAEIDLGATVGSEQLIVGIRSDSFVPSRRFKSSPDDRRLGVAVLGFELLYDP